MGHRAVGKKEIPDFQPLQCCGGGCRVFDQEATMSLWPTFVELTIDRGQVAAGLSADGQALVWHDDVPVPVARIDAGQSNDRSAHAGAVDRALKGGERIFPGSVPRCVASRGRDEQLRRGGGLCGSGRRAAGPGGWSVGLRAGAARERQKEQRRRNAPSLGRAVEACGGSVRVSLHTGFKIYMDCEDFRKRGGGRGDDARAEDATVWGALSGLEFVWRSLPGALPRAFGNPRLRRFGVSRRDGDKLYNQRDQAQPLRASAAP